MHGFLSFLSFAFMVAMLVDWARRRPEYFWLFLIIFLPTVGPLVYFLVVVLPTFQTGGDWKKGFDASRRIRELRARLATVDLPYVHYELGEALADRKRFAQALPHLEKAASGPEDIPEARYLLGICHARLGNHAKAIEYLAPIVKADPKFRFGAAYMQLGRSLLAAGRKDEALAAFEAILRNSSLSEARYHRTALLAERGEREAAKEGLTQLIAESADLPRFKYRQELTWIRKAKRLLRTL